MAQAALAAFIDIEADLRAASSLEELRFIAANATRRIAAYDQALVMRLRAGRTEAEVLCVSDVPAVSSDSPRIVSLAVWGAAQAGAALSSEPWTCSGPTAGERAILAPIGRAADGAVEVLALMRAAEWLPREAAFLKALAGACQHAAAALGAAGLSRRRRMPWRIDGWRGALASAAAALAALGLAFVQVPMFAYAPAEIVGADPVLVTAPIDGVIASVAPQPGQTVTAGQPLLALSDTRLRNEFEIAQRSRDLADTKHARLVQQATANRKDLSELATARAELAVAEAQLALAQDMLSRSEVRAETDGVAIFGAKSDWVGKPVQTGERVMEIVDPARIELRIDVSVADVTAAAVGAKVKLYLDGEPFTPFEAEIRRTSYRAQMTPDRILAFRAFAEFGKGQPALRIGLRGTARVAGPPVSLGFYLFRRPIAALRQRFGI